MSMQPGGGAPECPVCGTAIVEPTRLCARCETPHHADCWAYTGRCAVYACMGTAAAGEAPEAAVVPQAPADRSLTESAARVQPIVPVTSVSRAPCWQADAGGAWPGARDGELTVAPGERVVVLPPRVRAGLMAPEQRVRARRLVLQAIVAVAGAVGAGGALMAVHPLAAKVAAAALLSWAASAFLASRVRPPERAWLTVSAKGTCLHGITEARAWDAFLERAAAPRRVRLDRSYEDGQSDSSRTLLTYRLVLEWRTDPEVDPEQESHLLAPALQMPETAEARRPVLEQLVARRALGQHIAALLGIPFVEGVRAS